MGLAPHNPKVRCGGRSVIRYPMDHPNKRLRGQPILNEDGARQYKPCQGWAMHGSTTCNVHGGNAPQVIAAAKRRLALATHNVAEVLVQIAEDERVPHETRIKAAKEVMDRAGVRAGVDIALDAPRWQGILGRMFGAEMDDEETPAETELAPTPPEAETKRAPARKATRATKTGRPVKAPGPERPKFQGW